MTSTPRRLLALTLTLLLVAGLGSYAGAGFPDTAGGRFEDAAGYLEWLGVMTGDPDGSFRPDSAITRAEACKVAVLILGRGDQAQLLRGSAAFSDTAMHWASGYIAMAKSLGLVNGYPDGRYGPDDPVTYAQMSKLLVEATGHGPLFGLGWPANYVAAAQAAGFLAGVPGFQADALAVRGDCAIMTAQAVRGVPDPGTGRTLAETVFRERAVATVELLPAAASVPVGEVLAFAAVARNADGDALAGVPLRYSLGATTQATISSAGEFRANRSGLYTVTASAFGVSDSAQASAHGVARRLEVTPAQTLTSASGGGKIAFTVTVVDSTGVVVTGDQGTRVHMAFTAGSTGQAVTLGQAEQTVSAGMASFEATTTHTAGRADEIEFTAAGLTRAVARVTTVAQAATSIRVSASPAALTANTSTSTRVRAEVLDQYGQAMATGSYDLTFGLSGPGTFAGGATAARVVPTVGQAAIVDVFSVRGEIGQVVVTVSGPGLGSAQLRVTSYIAGHPVGIALLVADNTLTATETGPGADTASFQVQLVDDQGRAAPAGNSLGIDFEFADGDDPIDKGLRLDGDMMFNPGETTTGTLTLRAMGASSGEAGTHVLVVTANDPDLPSRNLDLVVRPGQPVGIRVWPAEDVKLPVAAPTATVYTQITDAAGNDVAQAGVMVAAGWEDPGAANAGRPTVAGVANPPQSPTAAGAARVATGPDGRAAFSFAAEPRARDDYRLVFTCGRQTGRTGTMTVAERVAGSLAMLFYGEGRVTKTHVQADRSDRAWFEVQVKDLAGNALGGWEVELDFGDGGTHVRNVEVEAGFVLEPLEDGVMVLRTLDYSGSTRNGKVVLGFQGGLAGAFTVRAQALELLEPVAKELGFRTDAGEIVAGVKVTLSGGSPPEDLDVDGDKPVALRLSATDHGGNPIKLEGDVNVLVSGTDGLYSTGTGGYFRLTSSSMPVDEGDYITIARGTSSRTIYWVQPDDEQGVTIGIQSSDDAYVSFDVSLDDVTVQAGPPERATLVVLVEDANGLELGGVDLEIHATGGTLNKHSGTTDRHGHLTVTWTGGDAGDVVTFTVRDALLGGGGECASLDVDWP